MEPHVTDINLYRTPVISQASDAVNAARLQRIWEKPAGWRGQLNTVDHKIIGIRYLVTAFGFLLLGRLEALMMRLQLAHAN